MRMRQCEFPRILLVIQYHTLQYTTIQVEPVRGPKQYARVRVSDMGIILSRVGRRLVCPNTVYKWTRAPVNRRSDLHVTSSRPSIVVCTSGVVVRFVTSRGSMWLDSRPW